MYRFLANNRDELKSETIERLVRYRNAVVPHSYVDGASDGIAFYKRAFGTVELHLGAALLDSTSFRTTTRHYCGAPSKLAPKKYSHLQTCSTAPAPPACATPSAMFGYS